MQRSRSRGTTSTYLNDQALSPKMQKPAIRKNSEVDMEDGIVDMESFGQILALDDGDSCKEFSKALVWSWCDQAEMAVEEMEGSLQKNAFEIIANKAHYLKGSSASLGLVQVSKTCQSIYNLHFPPSLAHFRSFSYQSSYSTYSGSDSSSGGESPNLRPVSQHKPGQGSFDFDGEKREKASELLNKLKQEIDEASEWLCRFYKESDLYEADGKTS